MQGTKVNSSPSNVRMFLRAGTAEELVGLQLQLNLLARAQFSFTDIQQDADGDWYAWFLADFYEHKDIVAELNGTTEE